jgi:ribosomal-protein-serine acetyltransferase
VTFLPASLPGGAVLRRLSVDDAAALFAAVDAHRARLGAWFPWVEATRTARDEESWIRQARMDPEARDGLGIFVDDALVGGAGLMVDPFRIVGEIGYWIVPDHEGRGLVTAAVRVLLREGFEAMGLHRIAIRAGVDNARSRAIPARLGFREEGVLRGEGKGSGGYYDLVVYGLLEDEWRGSAGGAGGTG